MPVCEVLAKQARFRQPSGKQPADLRRTVELINKHRESVQAIVQLGRRCGVCPMNGAESETLVWLFPMVYLGWVMISMRWQPPDIISDIDNYIYNYCLWFVNWRNRLPGHNLRQIPSPGRFMIPKEWIMLSIPTPDCWLFMTSFPNSHVSLDMLRCHRSIASYLPPIDRNHPT